MTSQDEVLLEQHFSYKNMDRNERNFYINLIMHTKDVSDSEIYVTNNDLSSYDIMFLNLSKENDIVRFDGAISNEYSNKLIYGIILKRNNKYFVNTDVYICNDLIYDEERKEYNVKDEFTFKDGKIVRRSRYQDTSYYESEIEFLNEEEMENYLQNKCNEMKLKR